jgi:hypothetical protein
MKDGGSVLRGGGERRTFLGRVTTRFPQKPGERSTDESKSPCFSIVVGLTLPGHRNCRRGLGGIASDRNASDLAVQTANRSTAATGILTGGTRREGSLDAPLLEVGLVDSGIQGGDDFH